MGAKGDKGEPGADATDGIRAVVATDVSVADGAFAYPVEFGSPLGAGQWLVTMSLYGVNPDLHSSSLCQISSGSQHSAEVTIWSVDEMPGTASLVVPGGQTPSTACFAIGAGAFHLDYISLVAVRVSG